jgi:c-di-GMP-binding flagellar brake protein YcgR
VSSIADSAEREVDDFDWANRRRTGRKIVRYKALVLLPDDQLLEAHTIDLSLGGACLSVPTPLVVGEECRMQMELSACGESRRVLLISEVCYRTQLDDGYRVGVRFVQLDQDTESFLTMLLL